MTPKKPIESLIRDIRSYKVILDIDLAELYGVPTKRLNEQVKRNGDRFPEDFFFRLTAEEWEQVNRSQIVTGSQDHNDPNRSQIATGSQRHRDPRFMPYAFTEHGAMMAAMVLSSAEAKAMSVYVIRAFVQMRAQIAASTDIFKRLAEMDRTLLSHDDALRAIWQKLQPLLAAPPAKPKPRIGFHP